MCSHRHNLWNDGLVGPFHAEYFGEFLEVVCSCLPNGEHCIAKPCHAKSRKLLVEELYAQLACQKRDVLNYG